MPLYIIFAWIASFSYGLAVVIGKLTSIYSIKNAWLFNFLYVLFTLIFIIPLSWANHVGSPQNWENIMLAGLFTALGFTFYVLALYMLDVSVLSPLFNFRTVFAVVLAALLVNEILTWQQYFLIGILFLGGISVSLDEKMSFRSFFRWPIAIAMMDMAFIALMGIFIKKAMAQNGYWEVTLWSNVVAQIILLLTLPLFLKDFFKVSRTQIGALAILALVDASGTLAANKAYAENVAISSAIISIPFSMIMAFGLSIFAPKILEKHTLKVYAIRFTAASVMILAALKLSI